MDTQTQVKTLTQTDIPSFKNKIEPLGHYPLRSTGIEILQINVGKLCNMTCKHCHVEAGPDRTEIMTKETLQACVDAIKEHNVQCLDITGGAPEMNPDLEWFLTEVSQHVPRIIVRSNLTVLLVPKYAKFLDIFAKNKIEVVASLPAYEASKTNKQRGDLVFERSIKILQELNKRGYGKEDTNLVLNLVHNPVGAYLPGSQSALETEYKRRLKQDFDINFNHLFCITNLPISRFLEYLIDSENYEDYMLELVSAFNPSAVEGVMCRNTLSVGWDGKVYDCDFNQMLDLPLKSKGEYYLISAETLTALSERNIIINNHCYGCTAGAGSSCQGALN